jgi:hypothetical protein
MATPNLNLGDGWTATRLSDGTVRFRKRVAVAPGHGFELDLLLDPQRWHDLVDALGGIPHSEKGARDERQEVHGQGQGQAEG